MVFAPLLVPANASLAYAVTFVAVMFAVRLGHVEEKVVCSECKPRSTASAGGPGGSMSSHSTYSHFGSRPCRCRLLRLPSQGTEAGLSILWSFQRKQGKQKMTLKRYATVTAVTLFSFCFALAQVPPPAAPKLKDEMRMPWKRGGDNFLRLWLIAGPFPGDLGSDRLSGQGGEANLQPADGQEQKRADGTTVKWHSQKSWGDDVTFDDAAGHTEPAVYYAFTKVPRPRAGRAMLSIGSADGIRLWLNSKLVLSRDGLRSSTPDEDQVEVEMNAGENSMLVKAPAQSRFCARVLEPGTVLTRKAEIGPSLIKLSSDGFTLKTDIGCRADRHRCGKSRGDPARRQGGSQHDRITGGTGGYRCPGLAGGPVRGTLQYTHVHRTSVCHAPSLVTKEISFRRRRSWRPWPRRPTLRSLKASHSECSLQW